MTITGTPRSAIEKRDWEGFIAQRREVERSARRPLILGPQDQGEIIIVERKRVGSLFGEDPPVHLRPRLFIEDSPVEFQYELFAILCSLQSSIVPNRVLDILHQEIAFFLMDDDAFYFDVIAGFNVEVKQEEDEVDLFLPPSHSDWLRAPAATYVTKSVDARYDLCLSPVTLVFFLADDLSDRDPSFLAEIFAAFRDIAMLRFVFKQPAGQISVDPAISSDINSPSDVVSRMRNMNHSIIHRLLARSRGSHGLPGAAHLFFYAKVLLQSVSPVHATKYEVLFCEALRLLSIYYFTEELLSWLPLTAGASYTRARLWLNLSRADDASLLENSDGIFTRI
ncbi:hypothetical protein Hypma_003379, partial [Hypsizygus marmoreus]